MNGKMKKWMIRGFHYSSLLGLALLCLVLAAGPAMALPMFASNGHANEDYNSSYDPASGTGTALYNFFIDRDNVDIYDDVSVTELTLRFEKDIFASVDNFSILSPDGWTTSLSDQGNAFLLSIGLAGIPATSANDPITLVCNYELNDSLMYDQASGAGWAWDSGGAWGQEYAMYGTVIGGKYDGRDVRSTGVTSPEPTTMLFFGVGLVCLAGTMRKAGRKKRLSC